MLVVSLLVLFVIGAATWIDEGEVVGLRTSGTDGQASMRPPRRTDKAFPKTRQVSPDDTVRILDVAHEARVFHAGKPPLNSSIDVAPAAFVPWYF